MSDTKPVLVIDGNVVGDVFQNATEDKVEVTADGVKTLSALLDELWTKIDLTKLSGVSTVDIGGINYQYATGTRFFTMYSSSNNLATQAIYIKQSGSTVFQYVTKSNNTLEYTDVSSSVIANGTKITLYYGNKTSQVDLTAYANKCMMSDGETSVEETIEDIDDKLDNIFNYRTLLTSSDDLNTLFKVGNYRSYSVSGMPINYPSTAEGSYDSTIKVEFTESDNMTIQTFEQFISGVPQTYKRRYFNGSWGNWCKLTWNALS